MSKLSLGGHKLTAICLVLYLVPWLVFHEPILSFLPIVRAARTAAEYETSAQIPSNGCVAYKVIIIVLETPTAA